MTTFPAAEGARLAYGSVPAAVRAAVDERLGSPVVGVRSMAGGFSPGVAAVLTTAEGNRVFVKAISSDPNPSSPGFHRREASVAAALPASAPAPRLRWSYDDGDWVVLCFDAVDGRSPRVPWDPDELQLALDAVADLAVALTPSPIDLGPVLPAHTGHEWASLTGEEIDRLPEVWRERIDALAELEDQWPEAVAGDTLLHLDLRADNMLVTDGGVLFVDWPWAAVGAAWVDLVAFLPSVAMQGGPDPEPVFAAHPVSRGADPEAVDAWLCSMAGMFTRQGLQPPPPGLPTVRAFQTAQAVEARKWLAVRRGWPAG